MVPLYRNTSTATVLGILEWRDPVAEHNGKQDCKQVTLELPQGVTHVLVEYPFDGNDAQSVIKGEGSNIG